MFHFDAVWKSETNFNVEFASKEGAESFLSIRGCKIVKGKDGDFVSWPSSPPKNDGGKWWSHVWANDKFNAAVLDKAIASRPGKAAKSTDDDQIPF